MTQRAIRKLQENFGAKTQSFRRLSLEVRRHPNEEHVHELRVTARRLRAILWVLKRRPESVVNKPLDQELKKLIELLGEQRELDVAIKDAVNYQLPIARLQLFRKEKQKHIRRYLWSGHRSNILHGLKITKDMLRDRPDFHAGRVLQKLECKLKHWQHRKLHRKELHKFRIVMKKVRYVLEAFGYPVKPLRKLQDHLGNAHDLEMLGKFTGRHKKVIEGERKSQEKARKQIETSLLFSQKQLKKIRATIAE